MLDTKLNTIHWAAIDGQSQLSFPGLYRSDTVPEIGSDVLPKVMIVHSCDVIVNYPSLENFVPLRATKVQASLG
jgi:hypothetical protein